MELREIYILALILAFLFCYGCYNWLGNLFSQKTIEIQSNGTPFSLKLPNEITFDGAIVTVTAGFIRHQQQGTSGGVLHFNLGDEATVETIEIYTPLDDKKYDFLHPPMGRLFEVPQPIAYFSYYDPNCSNSR